MKREPIVSLLPYDKMLLRLPSLPFQEKLRFILCIPILVKLVKNAIDAPTSIGEINFPEYA